MDSSNKQTTIDSSFPVGTPPPTNSSTAATPRGATCATRDPGFGPLETPPATLPSFFSPPLDMAVDELDELIEFLADKRADARAQAAEIVQGLTGSDDGVARLASKSETLIPKLLHLMGKPSAESKPAATALVNLTTASDIATLAVEKGAVERAMEFLRASPDAGGCPPDLLLSLLVNVTNTEGGVHVFSQEGKSLEGFFVMKLVQMLADAQPAELYDHAASVLTNVSRHPAGRRCFIDPSRGLVRAALPSMAGSASETRRVGVAAALRNCCVDDAGRSALLAAPGAGGSSAAAAAAKEIAVVGFGKDGASGATEGGLEAVRALLRPISAVKTAPERCDAVRQSCAEAVLGLAGSDAGRAALAACDAPRLLKVGYGDEEHPETMEAMEAAAEKFMLHGMVPAEMQPKDGIQRVEVVDDGEGGGAQGEEGEEEVEVVHGGPRPLLTPDVD